MAGIPVLGSLGQVPEIVDSMGCDGVAVTSDDATRYNYLRELAWALEAQESISWWIRAWSRWRTTNAHPAAAGLSVVAC